MRAKTPKDGRGAKFCGYCGAERTWSTEWLRGFDRDTGEPIMYHQWVCPRWPEEPSKHDTDQSREVVRP